MRPEDRAIAYSQTVKVAEMFLEWRHRVMAFTFSVISGLLALSAWMFDHNLGRAIAGPLFLGSLLGVASAVFDARNQRILYDCYRLADALEQQLGIPAKRGPLGLIPIGKAAPRWEHLKTYHGILEYAYRLLSIVLAAVAIYVLIKPPSP